MSEQNVGRPRGKTKFPTSISLRRDQIDWLKEQRNGSELISDLVDAMIGVETLSPENFKMLRLKTKLDHLTEKVNALRASRINVLLDNACHFKRVQSIVGRFVNYYIDNLEDPEPIDESGQIIKRTLKASEEAAKTLESEIEQIKKELLQK